MNKSSGQYILEEHTTRWNSMENSIIAKAASGYTVSSWMSGQIGRNGPQVALDSLAPILS